MQPVEREPGLFQVIERLAIERPQLRVAACMLDVTGNAVIPDVPMDSRSACDTVSNRLMTGKTALCRHALSRFVALPAVLAPLELRMGSGKGPG
jgi:hypothetical protein